MGFLFNTVKEFMKAASTGATATIEQYLRGDKASWLAARDKRGYGAIHNAVRNGHALVVQQLLDAGAGIDSRSSDGETPLITAIMYGQNQIVSLLLEKGADPNASGNYQPLAFAVGQGNLEAVKLLLAAKADPDTRTALVTAAQYRRFDIAAELVNAGAKMDVHDGNYMYLVHFAASNNGLDFMKILAEKGIGLDIQDSNGHTPMHYAVMYGHKQMVDLLLEKGARTDIENNQSQTPLELARERKNLAIIKSLEALEKKPEPVTAQPVPAGDETESWVRMGSSKVAFVGVYPEVGRKLTEIFNFTSRERIIITENLKSGAENITAPESFDNIAEEAVKQAHDAFTQLGGKAELTPRGIKKQLRQP